jgi:eukaryotic-like serine/threonine-protein kinase
VPYLVMAYVEGQPLSARLAAGPLDPERVAALGRQIAGALAHAHERAVVHRDVNPGNVLIDAAGDAHLTDFGIARLGDATRLTQTGSFMGTAAYVAPEQLRGDEVGPPADVYALGLTLLEALTGRREYTGTPVEAAMTRLTRPPVIPDGLPAPWPGLLAAMVAGDPAPRPTAAEVVEHLSGRGTAPVAATTAVLPDPASVAPTGEVAVDEVQEAPAVPRQRRRPAAWIVTAVVLLIIAAGLLMSADREPSAVAPTSLQEALDRLEATVTP